MSPRSLTRLHPGLAVGLAAAAALCAAPLPARASTLLEATGSGWVSPDDAASRIAMVVDRQTLPGGAQMASGSERLFMSNEANGNASMASISGMSYADYGVLRARVDGEARVMPQAANIPIYSDGTPRAEGGFGARFIDSITLYDPSLAIGAPVSYTFTVNIHVESNGAGHWGPQAAGYDTGSFLLHYFMGSNVDTMYMFPNGLYTSVPSYSVSLPVTLGGLNGDVLTMGANLGLSADDRAGYYYANNFYWFYGLATETHLDASNTVRFFLDPVTPGLQFIAESGHDYASAPVPEPGSWALLGAGLAFIGWRRRTGQRAACV